ncbi:hypothetical protein MSAN_01236900 [Mycena sanguinolenta]|uniref:C2H2-type domain-containing protein n=1 Tax=Mycena sanguinolenta TaxID=230812 RepID=A0A8H6YDA1_9AGAR|nr:hypothetical protein MSAN_01236900 [Mycena sanguinolenta]
MDPLNEIPDNNSNPYLQHEAQMWELDCLVEQELRAQQMQEDFGLEVDVGQLVDSYNGWFAMEQGALSCTPPDRKPLLSSNNFCITQPLVSSPDSCMRSGFGLDICPDDTLPLLYKIDQVATNTCSASTESSSPWSSRLSTPELPSSSYAPKYARQRESEVSSLASSSPSPSRESTPEFSPTPIRTRKMTRSYTNRRTPQKKTKSKKSPPLRIGETSLSILPPGAFWDADGKARCGIDGCTQRCQSSADLRRHRESLAHCRLKQHACPGCPMRFTREDALKRHLNHRGAARCKDPDLTPLRDEFLETEEAREAQREGKPDRVLIALYNAFLGEKNARSSKKRRRR